MSGKVSDSIDVHDLEGLQLKALWVLDKLSEKTKNRFSAAEIADYLVETCSVSATRQGVVYALKKEKGVYHKNHNGYKIMEPGSRKLQGVNSETVVFIESNKPFSAKNIILKDIFSRFRGRVHICDPYIDIHTLDVIFKNLPKTTPVRILTSNIKDKPLGMFARHLADIRKEGWNIEIGQVPKSTLHDRYFIDNSSFWLSGNSLNYLGQKESFIVKLGEDIRQSMLATFNTKWSAATKF
ncbi:MAG: hypothetical protein IH995_01980 [Proteobacteria bacterium]|nr:hypothetical protein [Pseudomonadota bacterium]